MTSIANKIGFYTALYTDYAGFGRGNFKELSDEIPATSASLKKSLRVHFWAPVRTQGAVVIVHDMIPELQKLQARLGLGWNVSDGNVLPEDACDWLVCFKAVPDAATKQKHRRTAMLICDQAEVFWKSLPGFDLQVASSSRPFASVVARANRKTYFVGESEPADYISNGIDALKNPPSKRAPVLMWHGGDQSIDALIDLKPALMRLAEGRELELHIVSGQKPERTERWGNLVVRYLPWSKDALQTTAASARLGIVPARDGARVSYLKPASRMRCMYALGVTAIGDTRVPDAVEFGSRFRAPLAKGETEWTQAIANLIDNPAELDRLAVAGHNEVAQRYSTRNTAARWVNLLGSLA